MSETYAAGGEDDTRAGRIILTVVSSLSALLVLAGLIYAAGTGARHDAALTAADCEPGLSPSGLQCTTEQMLRGQYMAVLTPATRQLNADTAGYTASETRSLAAAEAVLTSEVTTERAFDTGLAGITFPSAMTPIARALIHADEARATLTAEQARSSSLTQLESFNHRVQVATAAVQTEMTSILKAIDTPPQDG